MIAVPPVHVRRWLADGTRRFARRPVFGTDDIETAAANLSTDYYATRGQEPQTAWSDDDLERLVDAITSEYDSACDLSFIDFDVEGATQFSFINDPVVMIERRLATEQFRRRRRMTIAHEIGHVVVHRMLFQPSAAEMMELFTDLEGAAPVYCFREGIARGDDWMEWQASYFAAALLMPRGDVLSSLGDHFSNREVLSFPPSSRQAKTAIEIISTAYDVSADAAKVRLIEMRVIEPHDAILKLPLA